MATPQQIESLIRSAIPCVHLEVDGDGRHFQAVIVSSAFSGKSMVQQHQMVYQALGERMREEIHALSIRTFSIEDWNKNASG